MGASEWEALVGGLWWEASRRSLCSGPLVWGLWRGALMSGFWWDSSGRRPLGEGIYWRSLMKGL